MQNLVIIRDQTRQVWKTQMGILVLESKIVIVSQQQSIHTITITAATTMSKNNVLLQVYGNHMQIKLEHTNCR